MDENRTFIKLENVSYMYDPEEHPEAKAIDGVSMTVREGEFLAVVGPNGSGKSTLSKLFNGLLTPSEGDVWVDGINTKDEEHIIDIRRNVAMVFQNPDNQMVATIVEDDVAFGAENLGIEPSEIRKRIDESLEAVSMSAYRDKKLHQLSGGQKQRIAIAGVLAMKPRCIIFDESTAMLDPAGREDIIEIMHQLNREGVTIVFITHYMEEITDVDRIVILEKGKIIAEGKPIDIFNQVSMLHRARLDTPEIVWLCSLLRKGGLDIPTDTLTGEQLVEALCRLK
ncbi:MAG: energy-coupling factor transporter ATPase [Eubacteriaceae bacterium]|nr:energy-coupling factor transporter ATPase [Eubacteriaceae bacterium]MBR2780635.1 energy-coupling factor transporter ATPase [Eubacteriaceae bacterium]